MASLKERNLSDDNTSEIQIHDILSEEADRSDDSDDDISFALRLHGITDTNDVENNESENNGHIYAKVIDERNSASVGRRQRRSGVVNSMDGLNQISTPDLQDDPPPPEDQDEQESKSESPLDSSSSECSCDTSSIPLDSQNEEKEEDNEDETDDQISDIRNDVNYNNNKCKFDNGTDSIYDETKPQRNLQAGKMYRFNDEVQYDETKPKRKVSFDTAMPQIRRLKNDVKAEKLPIRKISLDTGLDAHNVRKISFNAGGVDYRPNPSNTSFENSNIRKISFDATSGTLHIRRMSFDGESERAPSVDLDVDSDTNSEYLRRVSYEADSEPEIGQINRGFDNDTYLDNVTYHVKQTDDDKDDGDLSNGYCSPKKQNGKYFTQKTSPETKSILKGGKKNTSLENVSPKKDSNGTTDTSSTLAAHVRKDSIALTSEKLGQILDIRKHYSQMHEKRRPLWKQRELLKKYQLHIGVAALFVLTLVLVSLGWYFHDRAREEKTISQRIFFEASTRNLKLSDPHERDDIRGRLGIDIPSWPNPTHCLNEKESQEFQCLNWRGNAILRISYFSQRALNCYNISWESLRHDVYTTDCFNIGPGVWYGPNNMSNPIWPIKRTNFTFSASYSQFFQGTIKHAIENYWLSSAGFGILVEGDIPLVVNWNQTSVNQFCITSNFTGEFYGYKTHFGKYFLNYTLCNGDDALTTHKYFRSRLLEAPTIFPAKYLYSYPLWSSIEEKETQEISEEHVFRTSEKLQKHNLSCSSIVLDGVWESVQGNYEFDEERFPNISTLVSQVIENSGCLIMLSISPYFDYLSPSFSDGHPKDHFILDASGDVPGLLKWKDKVVAMLDVTNPSARSWMKGKILDLTSRYKIDSFRLVYGQPQWLPFHPTFDGHDITPGHIRKLFTEMVSTFSKSKADVIEGTSQTQNLPIFISVPTRVESTEIGLCLLGAIPNALTLGLLGYPFVMADGIIYEQEKDYSGDEPDELSRQLFIRWIQMASFFPAMKYSLHPWDYDQECITVARNASHIHQAYVVKVMQKLKQEVQNGDPIIRPIWWIDPSDQDAHLATDEFLVGDDILVAPVLCEGVTSRRIYFPIGLWSDPMTGSLVIGKQWYDMPVALYSVPFFVRKDFLGTTSFFHQ